MQAAAIRAVVDAFARSGAPLVVPSFQNRRGHPWLISARLWSEVLQLRPPQTARDFLRKHGASIEHVEWDTDSILRDIDTPEDYRGSRP